MSLPFYTDGSSVINRQLDVSCGAKKSSCVLSDIDLSLCVDWIKSHDYKKVCLQFPDNLLSFSIDIALSLEKHLGFKVYILGDSSYASCCVDEITAAHVNADAIIHFGHACLSPVERLPVFFVLPSLSLDVNLFAERLTEFSSLSSSPSKILVVYDVGYFHLRDSIRELLQPISSSVVISGLSTSNSCQLPCKTDELANDSVLARKLGRCFPSKDILGSYSIVYIAGEDLANLEGFAVSDPTVPVYKYSEAEGISLINVNTLIRRKLFLIEKIKDASTIGVLVATLGVKDYLGAINRIKQLCKQAKKKSYIISVGKPNAAKLANFPEIEVFAMVCCPETRISNTKEFLQPIVSLMDVELALNKSRSWEGKTTMDFRDLLQGGDEYLPMSANEPDENEADVSLLTNKVRSIQTVNAGDYSGDQSIAPKQSMSCVVSDKLNLSSRSWQGLEQNLGLTPVVPVEQGRMGTPASGYTSTKSHVKS